MTDWKKVGSWLASTFVAMLGGGAAAVVPVISDPTKYKFPRDIGSGKLIPYILTGWALTFLGILLHSPVGEKVLASVKESQAKLAANQQELQQTKEELLQTKQNLKEADAQIHHINKQND